MRIATLQFSPDLGQVQRNIAQADSILENTKAHEFELLVLPELAFTGYNFTSLKHILPCLESAAGPSTTWARATAAKLRCVVTVGYPEIFHRPGPQDDGDSSSQIVAYNSTITVAPSGEILAHYRKTHLYYTDETWAQESPDGWLTSPLAFTNGKNEGHDVKAAFGICMDLNPRKFLSPWTAYEFSNAALDSHADLLILSMAWLTGLPSSSLKGSLARAPDMDTLSYWSERLSPLVESDREVIVVCANRCGEEEGQNPCGQAEAGVRYAGTSWIGKVGAGEVRIWRVLGRGEEGLCIADTGTEANLRLSMKNKGDEEVDIDES